MHIKMDQSLHKQIRFWGEKNKKSHSIKFNSSSLEDVMKIYFEKFSAAAYEILLILVNFIPYRIFSK